MFAKCGCKGTKKKEERRRKNEEIDKRTFVLTFFIDYFIQWLHHKLPFVHQRMRYLQVGLVYLHIVVCQYVDVYHAVVVSSVNRLRRSAHLLLYAFRNLQHLTWREPRCAAYGGIDEEIVGLESPRLSNEQS